MLDLPASARLVQFAAAVKAVLPVVAFGFTTRLDDHRASILHVYDQGLGEWIVPNEALPAVVEPSSFDVRHADMASLVIDPVGAFERFLADQGATRVTGMAVPASARPMRFWVALGNHPQPDSEQLVRLTALAGQGPDLVVTPPDQRLAQLQRLELAANVLPTLLDVLDVREVFERVSIAARDALPHDVLLTILFNDDLTTFSIYARSDRGTDIGPVLPLSYAAAAIRAWTFAIVDDHLAHPLERNTPATQMGARSSLRVPIRHGGKVIGGLGFVSNKTHTYSTADVPVARRLADQVAVGLSHHRLAEDGRRAVALRERAANLELLDELLETVVESDQLADVFGRVSEISKKVVLHDAAMLSVWLPDGLRARLYASHGFPDQPEIIELPDDVRSNPQWEHAIFDDVSQRAEQRYVELAKSGFRSLLRVPIRHEGLPTAALVFLAKGIAAFTSNDVAIARRIADRLAVALARDRELAAAKRADAATERAAQLEARVRALTDELNARSGFRRVIGESASWRQVLTQATQVAATTTTVLLLGESGTGKEVVARFLHRGSPRSGGPFIALNCAALPEQLLESELFGYERGAFTGAVQSKPGQLEQASGGTLFLDEVAEMSPSAQAKFLRVLQEREFQRLGGTRVLRSDARIIAATNRDLVRDISNGKFREDLYYRLNVFAIQLPPLRDRRDDILLLSDEFLTEIGGGLGRPPAGISRDARQMLMAYHWPGNVRELRNVLERAAILCDGGLITAEHLALTRPAHAVTVPSAPAVEQPPTGSPATGDLNSVERTMIEQALKDARFNKSKAAKALGLTRHQLYIRMRKHGFD